MKQDNKKHILLLCGGGQTEHGISLISSKYLEECLKTHPDYQVITVVIEKDKSWKTLETHDDVELIFNRKILKIAEKRLFPIDLVVPCIHGHPGETGDIQSLLEIYNIPFFGSASEANKICFNKINTKLWLQSLNIPNTPFIFLHENNEASQEEALSFLKKWKNIFVKASHQGSSVGCYPVNDDQESLLSAINKAFQFSPYVLLEKKLKGRELEVSVYEYQGEIFASSPGEILCPSGFYSFEEKYSSQSQTQTRIKAPGLSQTTIDEIKKYSLKAFRGLKLRHLSRIDFFLTEDNQIYLNEINTFPGMTPISMFPKMIEGEGVLFKDYIVDCITHLMGH